MIKNKRGASLSGWTEIAIFSLLFVAVFAGIILTNMNAKYGKNFETGLVTNASQTDLTNYQTTLQNQIIGGEVSFDSTSGLTLKSSWEIITSAFTMIGNFITGSWIEKVVSLTLAPPIVATYLRILWFISLGFIILKILFKVKA